jgi:hypothetical protein
VLKVWGAGYRLVASPLLGFRRHKSPVPRSERRAHRHAAQAFPFDAVLDARDAPEGSLPVASATNQQAELLGAAYALHSIPEGQDVMLLKGCLSGL